MKKFQKNVFVLWTVIMVLLSAFAPMEVQAASLRLNVKKVTLQVGETKTLKVSTSLKGKVKWKSSNQKVASVSGKGKVKAKKAGKAVITAKLKSKKVSCTVVVKKAADEKSAAKKNAKTYQKQIEDIVKRTNRYRAQKGIAPLVLDSKLTLAACHRSAEMAKTRLFSHTRPDGSTPFDLMRQYGISYSYAGENIAYTRGMAVDAAKAAQMWYDSQGHRENMLRKEFGKMGVGIAVTDDGEVYYTQLFTN